MKLFTRFLERYSRFDEGREKEESNDGLTFEGKEIKRCGVAVAVGCTFEIMLGIRGR